MVDEDLKALSPISKLQARNEIQMFFKYRMAAIQDSLQRKLNSVAMVDNFSPINIGKHNQRIILEAIFKLIFCQILAQTLQVGTVIGYTELIWTIMIFLG